MKKVMRPRYYCEFCKKSGGSSYHMQMHERGCTANPSRVCRMCGMVGAVQKPIVDLIAAIDVSDARLTRLREAAENCPACILAAIRQSNIQKWNGDLNSVPPHIDFDFKAECRSLWADINAAQAERDASYY